MSYGTFIPVNVVTGFLGSGKTTLLQRLLASPLLTDTAVLVNEFGEVGLDHHLLTSATQPTLLMDNGCVCCAIRGDLQDALRGRYAVHGDDPEGHGDEPEEHAQEPDGNAASAAGDADPSRPGDGNGGAGANDRAPADPAPGV